MRETAAQFKVSDIEAKINSLLDRIKDVEQELLLNADEQAKLTAELNELVVLLASRNGSRKDYLEKIAEIKSHVDQITEEILVLRKNLTFNIKDLQALRLKRQDLDERLRSAVGDLLTLKETTSAQLTEYQNLLSALYSKIAADEKAIARLLQNLNTELNLCRRKELLLTKFKDEYDVQILLIQGCLREAQRRQEEDRNA